METWFSKDLMYFEYLEEVKWWLWLRHREECLFNGEEDLSLLVVVVVEVVHQLDYVLRVVIHLLEVLNVQGEVVEVEGNVFAFIHKRVSLACRTFEPDIEVEVCSVL